MNLKKLEKYLGDKKRAKIFKKTFNNLTNIQYKEFMKLLEEYYSLKEENKKLKKILSKKNSVFVKNNNSNIENLLEKIQLLEKELKLKDKELEHKLSEQERKILTDILVVIDTLEIALTYIPEDNKDIRIGIENTIKKFKKILNKYGIEEVQHEVFEPEIHQAVGMEESEEETGKIIKILQKGYIKNGKLIRPALVIIAK